jgi:hypothetical protein
MKKKVVKLTEKDLKRIINKIVKESELDENFDDSTMKHFRKNKEYSEKEFKRIPKGVEISDKYFRDDSVTPNKFLDNQLEDLANLIKKYRDSEED